MPTAIRKVRIEGFKRFDDVEFVLPGHIVVAGPNNSGKTTLLQAIAAWSLALTRWKELNDFQRHGGGYTQGADRETGVLGRAAALLRPAVAEPDVHRRASRSRSTTDGWTLPMKLEADSTEQIYVRPAPVEPADCSRRRAHDGVRAADERARHR